MEHPSSSGEFSAPQSRGTKSAEFYAPESPRQPPPPVRGGRSGKPHRTTAAATAVPPPPPKLTESPNKPQSSKHPPALESPRQQQRRGPTQRTRSMEDIPKLRSALGQQQQQQHNNNNNMEQPGRRSFTAVTSSEQPVRRSLTAVTSSEQQQQQQQQQPPPPPRDNKMGRGTVAVPRSSFSTRESSTRDNDDSNIFDDVVNDDQNDNHEEDEDEEESLESENNNLSASAHRMMNRASVYYHNGGNSDDSSDVSFVDELNELLENEGSDDDGGEGGDRAQYDNEEEVEDLAHQPGGHDRHKYDQHRNPPYGRTTNASHEDYGRGPHGNVAAFQPSGEEIQNALERISRQQQREQQQPSYNSAARGGDLRNADYPTRQDSYDDQEEDFNDDGQEHIPEASNRSLFSDDRSGHNTEEEVAAFERASLSKKHGILNRGGEVDLMEMSNSHMNYDIPHDGRQAHDGHYDEEDRYNSGRGRRESSARDKYISNSNRSLDSMLSDEEEVHRTSHDPHDMGAPRGTNHSVPSLGSTTVTGGGRQPSREIGMHSSSHHSYAQRSHTSNSGGGGGGHDSMNASGHSFARSAGYHGSDSNVSHRGGSGGGGGRVSRQSSTSDAVSLTEEGLNRLSAARGDPVGIVYVMLDFPDSEPVQSSCLRDLSDLDLTPEDCDAFAEVGGMEAIADAMERFPNEAELQLRACRALCLVSGTPENQLGLVDVGAADLVLNGTMDKFAADPELQEEALASLANLAALVDNLEPLMEKEIVRRTVQTMNRHRKDIQVQMKGCGVIANLAAHPSPMKEQMMADGGGGAIVLCMALHQKNAKLQEKGLQALRNLSANCEGNKLELAHLGGIDSCITAMQVHRNDPYVQEAGAWTLCNLAGNMNNKQQITDSSGVDVILRAMWVHTDQVTVHEWCLRALFSLTANPSNLGVVVDVGGIAAVVASMQAHEKSPVAQEMGCGILANLGDDEEAKLRIVDEEALDAIVLAMVLFVDDVKVQERACEALFQLAIADNLTALQATNVMELVRAAVGNFPDECGDLGSDFLDKLEDLAAEYNTR